MSGNDKPALYRCGKCKLSVVVTVEARVTCVKCARAMKAIRDPLDLSSKERKLLA